MTVRFAHKTHACEAYANETHVHDIHAYIGVGYDSIRAMIEMGIVYELILPNRRKQYTVLISYDEQATLNTLGHV